MPIFCECRTLRASHALRWRFQIRRLTGILGGLLILAAPGTRAHAASVPLAWDPSTNASVGGYKIYYGIASRDYTASVDVGNVTNAVITGLSVNTTYYFAATTYDTFGVESGFSSEVTYQVPTNARVALVKIGGQLVLTVTGPAGQTNQIQATQDFKVWTVVGTVVVGAGGSLNFTDTNAAIYSKRFYRTQATP